MLLYMKQVDTQDSIRRIIIRTMAQAMLTGVVAREMFNAETPEVVMGTAFGLGFIAWSFLGAVAKFFSGRQDQDIVQMMKSVNEERTPSIQPYQPMQSHNIDNPDA